MSETIQINVYVGSDSDSHLLKVRSSGNRSDLDATFIKCYGIFNDNKDPTIGGYLDPFVTVYAVSDQKPNHGYNDAVQYFKDQYLDKPNFTPIKWTSDISADGLTGHVVGTATWIDKNNPEIINFTFTFVYDGSKWRILSL